MAEEIDIFMAKIVRKAANQPWGFRIEGGYNTGHPLRISAVAPGSPAGSIGLQAGDVITKIFDRQTKFMTHQQAADVIGAIKNDTLTLTVERNANEVKYDHHDQQQHQPHQQQHQHHQQQQEHPSSPASFSQANPSYVGSARISLSPPQEIAPQQQHQQHHQQQQPLTSTQVYRDYAPSHGNDDEEVDSFIPQSRTFRRLQNFMENNQPPLGAAGLPPPRSASMEQMRQQQQLQQRGQGRVKVIMPQKYNNPLGLYSADNVIDTFSSQVGSILETYSNNSNSNSNNNQ